MNKSLLFVFVCFFLSVNFDLYPKYLKSRNGLVDVSELFASPNLIKNEDFMDSDPEVDILKLLDSTYIDLRETLLDRNIVGLDAGNVEILYFFQDLSPLVYQVSSFDEFGLVNQDEKQVICSLFSNTVSAFVKKMNFEEINKIFPEKKFCLIESLRFITENNDRAAKVKEIIDSPDKNVAENFIKDFFMALSCHLSLEIDLYISNVNQKLICSNQTKSSPEKRRKRKQRLAAIFQALANACMQIGQVVGKPKQQGVLSLFGTILNLTSQVITGDSRNEEEFIDQTKMYGIGHKILASKLFQRLASTVLICLQEYIHEKLEMLLDYLCHKILILILGDNVQSDIDNINDNSSGENILGYHEIQFQ